MMTWIVALVLALQPLNEPLEDQCSLIELNTVHSVWADDGGEVHVRVTFHQVILWDLHADGWYRVVAWRVPGSVELGKGMVTWCDGSAGGRMRRVRAPLVIVTWTDYDPEMQNRNPWPESRRRELSRR